MEQSYKEKYEDILARLERAKNDNDVCDERFCCVIDDLIPELAESEDEKVRKALLELVHDTTGDELWIDYNVHKEEALDWLERQGDYANFLSKIQVGDKVTRNEAGVLVNLSQLKRVAKPSEKQAEQKPAEWSEEDEYRLNSCLNILQPKTFVGNTETINTKWLKSLKGRVQPKQEWGKEEDGVLLESISVLQNTGHWVLADKLKSLRPQNNWKPSELQLGCLSDAIKHYNSLGYPASKLKELLDDLKKLNGGEI